MLTKQDKLIEMLHSSKTHKNDMKESVKKTFENIEELQKKVN